MATDGSLNFERNQIGVHADMNGAGNAGQNRTAHFTKSPIPGRLRSTVAVLFRSRFEFSSRHTGNKRMGDKLALFVRDVDIAYYSEFRQIDR